MITVSLVACEFCDFGPEAADVHLRVSDCSPTPVEGMLLVVEHGGVEFWRGKVTSWAIGSELDLHADVLRTDLCPACGIGYRLPSGVCDHCGQPVASP